MHLTNANKAFIITLLLSAIVVLSAYNVSVLKENERMAETYLEITANEEEDEKQEELVDVMESLDRVLATNKAYNTTRDYEDFEDEEFKSTMEKIKNRDAGKEEQEAEGSDEQEGVLKGEESESFNNINDIIAKRSQKNRPTNSKDGANKDTSISFSLIGRNKYDIPIPVYLCEKGGKIVVNITVDGQGNVIESSYNGASSSTDGCMIDHALEYANASKFDSSNKSKQIGTITFIFQGK